MTASANTVGILGAGTMGAGIAQVAAMSGWTVELLDVDQLTVRTAIEGIHRRLDRLVEKGRMQAGQRDAAVTRLHTAGSPRCFGGCELVIEAVVEDIDVKTAVLRGVIERLPDNAIIATNTSSLSVTRLGEAIGRPGRTVGMHFFNPAPLMKLVEVVAGDETEPEVVDRTAGIAEGWGKVVARAADVPGFIVNHVARPYYLEALRILEEGLAGPGEIDYAMREIGGFRMGPLELTDLIGQDVNTATSRSVWEALDRPALLKPSGLQEQLVADGHLGRKTGRGVYSYEGESPVPAVEVERSPLQLNETLSRAVSEFSAAATDVSGTELDMLVFSRILVAIIVQAALAHERGVADTADIDTALKYGTNYPKGPFEWARQIGHGVCVRLLDTLNATVSDNRFAVPALLRE